ncbi:MAG: aminoacyl-tRNA hydrolase [Patescibacteria group bacterium]
MHVIVGLGNPGNEYKGTRHNAGRLAVERIHATHDFSLWKTEKKPAMQVAMGSLGGVKVTLVIPDTYMNKSGHAAAHFVKHKKGAGSLIVIHDDLDMPLGSMKVSFGRSSGGHNGVESIIKALKTKDFVRIRVGVSPAGVKGVVKKLVGEGKVLKFLLGKFRPEEMTTLTKVLKRAVEACEVIVRDGHQKAMNEFNQ